MNFPSPTKAFHREPYAAIDPRRPELSTAGKNVMVTGGGRGIGIRMAYAFAQSGASHLAVVGRTASALAETQALIAKDFPATEVHVIAADTTDAASIGKAVAVFADGIRGAGSGKIDVLVANVGYMHTPTPIDTVDANDWWMSFQVNVLGSFNTLRAFVPHAAPDAVVLDVSAGGVHFGLIPDHSGYVASKLAATRVFDYFGQEHPGMRVIHLHPGIIETDMSKKTFGSGIELLRDHVDLAGWFVVWLASPEAAFLRNKFVWSNWDVDELKAMASEIEQSDRFTIGLMGWGQPE